MADDKNIGGIPGGIQIELFEMTKERQGKWLAVGNQVIDLVSQASESKSEAAMILRNIIESFKETTGIDPMAGRVVAMPHVEAA